MFGFIFVIIMDATRSGPETSPPNNMTNALIFQAAIAGVIMFLSFAFQGRMARSEALAWEAKALERLTESSDKENTQLTSSTYPLSSVLGITLTDGAAKNNDEENSDEPPVIRIEKEDDSKSTSL